MSAFRPSSTALTCSPANFCSTWSWRKSESKLPITYLPDPSPGGPPRRLPCSSGLETRGLQVAGETTDLFFVPLCYSSAFPTCPQVLLPGAFHVAPGVDVADPTGLGLGPPPSARRRPSPFLCRALAGNYYGQMGVRHGCTGYPIEFYEPPPSLPTILPTPFDPAHRKAAESEFFARLQK